MNAYEIFALDFFLSKYPEDSEFKDVLKFLDECETTTELKYNGIEIDESFSHFSPVLISLFLKDLSRQASLRFDPKEW